MKKKLISLLLSITTILSLTACGTSSTSIDDGTTHLPDPGEYILTTTQGEVDMYDSSGNLISSVSLGGTPESEYIYALDEGNIYLPNMQYVSEIPQLMYAVDKTTRKLTMLTINKNSIAKTAEMILSDGNITKLYGYNGVLYYSVETQGLDANSYSFERRQKLNENGTLSYVQTVPLENTSESTFIYMENYFEEYLKAVGLSNKHIINGSEVPIVSESDSILLNIPEAEHAIYEIPTKVTDWTANNTNIYFFADTQMGTYNTTSNKITVYYGPINPISVQYMDGIDKENYVLSDFGTGSTKTILLSVNYDDMKIENAIQIDYNNPMQMHIEKDEFVMMLFKVTNSDKTFSQLRVLNYEDYKELYVMGIEYLPTKILSKGEIVYLFNPYEHYFLSGSIHSGGLSKISKETSSGDVYSDIFLVDVSYESDYYYDEYGRYINKNNHLINEDGELIDENNDRVNILGQRIDALGRAINKEGDLIDRYNNIIDIDGNIIRYVKNADGYYYNGDGKKVDSDGTVLVRNDEGLWVRPEEAITEDPVITGHYDEYGNFIVDKDILEEYPDAYEIWQRQQLGTEENSAS